jgi:hypothetical protein
MRRCRPRWYVRGFVRAYCTELGVSADEALALYEVVVAPTPAAPRHRPSWHPRPGFRVAGGGRWRACS